ncbi:putative membrane protein [Candidatus Ichthyocystis hellenicum]|uniref:Putative membrane protein n=1 Tax=Candidatus Ichthyocystis hellenicum TaxID=1561003 RepID=A0A0S4M4N3_9BURK|nr:hypothetical protein [Candidatus Ichthyocystis hellenicum]CUT17932.1 putative membrane protein [Candidatus Ichthyocystis hellenicum]
MNTDSVIFPEVNCCSDGESTNNADGPSCSSPIGTVRQSTVCRSDHEVNHSITGNSLLKRMSLLSARFMLRSSIFMHMVGYGDCARLYSNLCRQLCSRLCALIRIVDGMSERGIAEGGDLVGMYLNETSSGVDLGQLICDSDNKDKVKELVNSLSTETSLLANEASKNGYRKSYSDMYEVLSAAALKTPSGDKIDMCNSGEKFCKRIKNYVSYNHQKHQTTTTTTTTDVTTSGTTLLPFTDDVTAGDETSLPFTDNVTTADATSMPFTDDVTTGDATLLPFTDDVTTGDATSLPFTDNVTTADATSLPFADDVTTGGATTSFSFTDDVTTGDATSMPFTDDVTTGDATSMPFTDDVTTADTTTSSSLVSTTDNMHLTTSFYDIDRSDNNMIVIIMSFLFLIGIIAVLVAVTRKGIRRLCGRKRRGDGTAVARSFIYFKRPPGSGSNLELTEV